jgi:hypothetical protein
MYTAQCDDTLSCALKKSADIFGTIVVVSKYGITNSAMVSKPKKAI